MKHIFTLLFIVASALYSQAQSCAGRYQDEVFTDVTVTTVDFGEAMNMANNSQVLKMDIYTPDGDTATNRPVVIFCFGGSFVAGDRTSGELVQMATSLAKRGYVAASIDYRLAGSPFDLIQEEVLIKVVFGAVQDGKAAIRYFRKDFDEGNALGIDPDQIFIGGTSAGGILAINLAYVDTLAKLPTQWQTWANEIGGIEGNSGNPGYCSYVSGVFGFAGAVADTNFINANDVPFYGSHATGDQTVQYGFGAPLNGLAPVDLYGSGEIETRMNNLGIYHLVDTYSGGDHPPLTASQAILDSTQNQLVRFLYNIVDCNPSNLKQSFQQDCDDFYTDEDSTGTSITNVINNASQLKIYPNPTQGNVTISNTNTMEQIQIVDAFGKTVYAIDVYDNKEIQLSTSNYAKGMYYVKVYANNTWFTNKLLVK